MMQLKLKRNEVKMVMRRGAFSLYSKKKLMKTLKSVSMMQIVNTVSMALFLKHYPFIQAQILTRMIKITQFANRAITMLDRAGAISIALTKNYSLLNC